MIEIWRDIKGYEGLYQVSNCGRVRSSYKGGRILKPNLSFYGYWRVQLWRGGKGRSIYVHRLVAQAFIPNPDGKPQINHINGIKTDNRVENLEWCTNMENQLHASKTDLKSTVKILQLDRNGNVIKEWPSMVQAAQSVGVSKESIFACCNGLSKTSKNFIWRYKEAE